MNRLIISCFIALIGAVMAYGADKCDLSAGSPLSVIPVPAQVEMAEGHFVFPDAGTTFFIKGKSVNGLSDYLESLSLGLTPVEKAGKAVIMIEIKEQAANEEREDESYALKITPRRISVKARNEAGAFYAFQTLLQMTRYGKNKVLACCEVNDSPRFSYRGLHFDVSRHFRSKEFVMKQMDAMALLKMNRLHLHLTNGAGWRIQIDRYPRLTDFAAWREGRDWMEWTQLGAHYCDKSAPMAYGGYYTKEDIREILAYAKKLHITVIPEIGMPGHSEEVLAAYPELSCSGEPYKNSDYCIGKEEVFTFLENVLTEVMELFPSEYIHIGGDEAVKSGWRTCPDCQKRMKEEGLESVEQLQSYFIHRIEEFVNSKGRKIIGFDEILQGGLAPNATVMSWRGTEGGIKAMKSGHNVIMTPVEYYYLDYSQDAPFKEPVSIGGYSPLKTVYSYEPAEPGLTQEELSYLIGVQGNLWSEYIPEDSHAEYMYYPRAFAVAETGWSRSQAKNYAEFRNRAIALLEVLDERGYTTFDLANEYGERNESLTSVDHLAKGCKITYNIPYSRQWPGSGDSTLVDGIQGGWTYRDMKWQGTMKKLDVTIDLGKVQPVHYVGASFMHSVGAWVYVPKKVEVFLSENGNDFVLAGTVRNDVPDEFPKLLFKNYSTVCHGNARYVRFVAEPNDKPGSWLFVDEIIVN